MRFQNQGSGPDEIKFKLVAILKQLEETAFEISEIVNMQVHCFREHEEVRRCSSNEQDEKIVTKNNEQCENNENGK